MAIARRMWCLDKSIKCRSGSKSFHQCRSVGSISPSTYLIRLWELVLLVAIRWQDSFWVWSLCPFKDRYILHPPPSSSAFLLQLVELVAKSLSLLFRDALSDYIEDLEMFLLEVFEAGVQLFVPRVQHKHLEAERGGGDHEVGERNGAC